VEAPHPRLPRPGLVDYRLLGRTREDELTEPPDWYRDRPEPEQRFRGTIRRRETGPTPGGRDRLPFGLVRSGVEDLPIYGPAAEAALGQVAAVADREVEIIGKLIHRGEPGAGAELWVADGSAVRPIG
jgi:hypothetical protein